MPPRKTQTDTPDETPAQQEAVPNDETPAIEGEDPQIEATTPEPEPQDTASPEPEKSAAMTEAEEGWQQQNDAALIKDLTQAYDNIVHAPGSDVLRGANMDLQQSIGIVARRILARESVRQARG